MDGWMMDDGWCGVVWVSYGMDGWGMGDGIYIGIQYRNRNLKF